MMTVDAAATVDVAVVVAPSAADTATVTAVDAVVIVAGAAAAGATSLRQAPQRP